MESNFAATARGVLDGVGGMENVKSVLHCATRLRFTLLDIAKADDGAVKAVPGVVSVIKAGGLYQVVVKDDVQEVFAELKKLGSTVGAAKIDTSKVKVASARKVFAPVKGRVLALKESADLAHREEALGKGVCIMPLGGKIFAPFDGIVEMVFDTKHAVSVKGAGGVELMIHCGIDTVKLRGAGFTVHVAEGDSVKAGQLILEYDKDVIVNAGYSLETQVVVTNTGDFMAITQAKGGDCEVGDLILYVE